MEIQQSNGVILDIPYDSTVCRAKCGSYYQSLHVVISTYQVLLQGHEIQVKNEYSTLIKEKKRKMSYQNK